jgi:hypothetical protein
MNNTSPKRDGLIDSAGLREFAESSDEVFQLARMARGKQHGMAGLDPEPADSAADMTGTDDADALLWLRRRAAPRTSATPLTMTLRRPELI